MFCHVLFAGLIIIGPQTKLAAQEYFRQEVNYSIQVTLNDKCHELNASEIVTYINNSPDTLRFIYFHLWPNAYSNNRTELARQLINLNGKARLFNDPELHGYIDSLDFKADGRQVQWDLLPDQPDICLLRLNHALKPGDTVVISTHFHVKIPKGVTSRLGHIGESYQISQWYPKPAVYDRTGWHQISDLDQGEYYSEFGSFDVSITLPANYIVGATGNLQNEGETQMLNNLAADTTRIKAGLDANEFPPSSRQMKTLRYTENRIHDFAWFADKRFKVLKGNVKLPESGRTVTTWVMYTGQQAELWKDAIPYVNQAIWYFSKWNGEYPYQSFTAVQSALSAGDGMEYPGITVIGMAADARSLDEVIAHEICHSWFYSSLGSDERRYPFLDEGITSANEVRYMDERYPEKKLWEVYVKNQKLARFFNIDKLPQKLMGELEWLSQARDNLEQPLNLPAADFTGLNYGLMVYGKAGMSFNYLRATLGDSVYDAAMHEYFTKWKFKHPYPDDLRQVFETATGRDLSWFFTDLTGTTKRMDYQVVRMVNHKLLIKNKGELKSPVIVCGMLGDSICFKQWVDGFEGQQWIDIPEGNYTSLKIDPEHITPELFRLNNNIRTSGFLRKADPIRFQPYITLEDPEKRYIMFFPAFNWTRENGTMAGIALHNGFLTPKLFEYFIIPFYAFHNADLAGFGRIAYNRTPYDKRIRKLTVFLEGAQFGAPGNQNFHKVKAGLDIYFTSKSRNKSLNHSAFLNYICVSDLSQMINRQHAKMNSFLQSGYQLEKASTVNPYSLLVSAESGASFLKASLEVNYRFSYYGIKKGLDIRLFAGTMLKSDPNVPFFSLAAGGRSGIEQYLLEGMYPDRFSVFPSTFWSRQMSMVEGGLASPVNEKLGFSRWLISVSVTCDLPGGLSRIPVKPFVNFLVNDHGSGTGHNSVLYYEFGVKTGFWNFFEVYIPCIVSGNIESITGSFKDRIRLVFNLGSLKQVKLNSGLRFEIE